MRGAIDYIVVGFGRNDFDGTILESLKLPLDHGVIAILGFAIVAKDQNGDIYEMSVADTGSSVLVEFTERHVKEDYIDEEDIFEIGELLERGTAAGMIVIEQLWSKPFKKALMDKEGFLIAEGRIHPDAAEELN